MYDDLSEEEFKLRLKQISDEVKADIKAGRYKGGLLHPDISTKQFQTQSLSTMELLKKWAEKDFAQIEEKIVADCSYYGTSIREVFFDEAHYICPETFWLKSPSEPKEKDWNRKFFKSGPSTPPSEARKAELKSKRKKRK